MGRAIQNIRVSVDALKAKIRERIEKEEQDKVVRAAKYETEVALWHMAFLDAIQEVLDKALKGDFPRTSYNNCVSLQLPMSEPMLDSDRYRVGYFDIEAAKRDLVMLDMATDETILINSESNWAAYL